MSDLKVTIAGKKLVVKESSMREVLPIMENNKPDQLGIEIAKLAVIEDGVALGDGILDFPFSAYSKIMEAVNKVHGFGTAEEEGNEKNA